MCINMYKLDLCKMSSQERIKSSIMMIIIIKDTLHRYKVKSRTISLFQYMYNFTVTIWSALIEEVLKVHTHMCTCMHACWFIQVSICVYV